MVYRVEIYLVGHYFLRHTASNMMALAFVNKNIFPILEIFPMIHPQVRVLEDFDVCDSSWPAKLI
jgi:glucose-6-phosphate 1-dehydrogenase